MATTIALEPETRERLRTFGHAGMSYDEIVRNLMDQVDRERYMAELHREADNEKNWVEMEKFDWGA